MEVNYCDRCGARLPVEFLPGAARVCPNCQWPIPEKRVSTPARRPSPTPRPPRRVPTPIRQRRTFPPLAAFGLAAAGGIVLSLILWLLIAGPAGPGPAPQHQLPPPPPIQSAYAGAQTTSPQPSREEPAASAPQEEDIFAEIRKASERRRMLAALGPEGLQKAFDADMSDAAAKVLGQGWSVRNCSANENPAVGLKEEHLGRSNVLVTHPLNDRTPCVLEKTVKLPEANSITLTVAAATINAAEEEDWVLRFYVDDTKLAEEVVGRVDGRASWQVFVFNLSHFAGRTVKLRLENASGGRRHLWAWEHGVWAEARLDVR